MTRIALLWHMHQPFYGDLVTGEHLLPWVRLHALKDYYGMVALLREFPDIRVTFNLVPSLLVQVEAFAEGRAKDRDLDLTLKVADDLTASDVAFMLRNFFHAHRQRMIDVHPRYAELLARRDQAAREGDRMGDSVAPFSVRDLRDLQVWHKLAWIDPSFLEDDARILGLLAKGRDFTEADKRVLATVERELLQAVIPAYRIAAARGQAELSTSPFYHPILPLLCDTDIYSRTHPDAPRLRRRFAHPEDAREQIQRAIACHERLFGGRPAGLWPSEGSVSDAMVSAVADAGLAWMATDEMILARTLGTTWTRDREGQVEEPERLYRPYLVSVGGRHVRCVFRDHSLSDRIGFVYADWPADTAADDFISRLVAAGRRFTARTGGEEALIPIILDGENAWEHFEGGGRPFLRALYRRLSDHPELRTVTMHEACEGARDPLPGIFPGSWIDGNFYIWIGHADDRKAWSQLAEARDALDQAVGVPDAAREQAREEILIAEGSDWFWWYGDDHSSEHDLEFDNLFRHHLRNAYWLLNRTPPEELHATNISTGPTGLTVLEPMAFISPTIDGEVSSYFEWLGAGRCEATGAAGAMHQIDRPATRLAGLWFGFGPDATLFLRIDGQGAFSDLLTAGLGCSIRFVEPEGLRVAVRQAGGRATASVDRQGATVPPDDTGAGVAVAAGQILELRVDRATIGQAARLQFFITLDGPDGFELERHPSHRPVPAAAPDEAFVARHWRA